MYSLLIRIINNARLWQWSCVLVAIIACFWYCINLQPGHDWGGDFSQYIAHARNMVSGMPYKEIGHIQNPHATIAPETYPIVFPLLLAPVYAIFGINLLAFKVVVVFCFTGALLMLWPVFSVHLPPFTIFLITVLLAINPSFYLYKEHVLSEFPFLFFLLVCFYFMQKALVANNSTQTWIFYGLTGLGLFLVTGTRSAGIVLLPAWVGAVFLLKNKPRGWFLHFGFSLLIFLFLIFLQKVYLDSAGESYIDQFRKMYTDNTISNNLESYYNEAGLLWVNGAKPFLKNLLLKVLLGLSLIGLLWRSKERRPGVFEIFTLAYLVLTFIWPWPLGFRMLIPLVPLVFFFAFYAVTATLKRRPSIGIGLSAALFLLWFIPYFRSYRKMETTLPVNFLRPETEEMFAYIRSIPADARVMFEKPRVLALYTGRAAMVKHCMGPDDVFAAFLREMEISVLVIPKKEFQSETGCLKRWIERNPAITELQFENEDFAVYKYLF